MDWETALTGANAAYLEELLSTYQHDRNAVPETWRQFFDTQGRDFVAGPVPISDPGFRQRSIFDAPATEATFDASSGAMSNAQGNEGIFQLINAHRVRGHLNARLDPLGFGTPYEHPELTPAYWGFSDADLDRVFATPMLKGPQSMTLRELVAYLRDTYCRTIGVEFMHIHNVEVKNWLQERFERNRNHTELDRETMSFIFEQLSAAEAFEHFLHVKYRGSKRFSLQGAETLIPMLSLMIEEAADQGVRELVMGMAHRGRLNVLVNIFKKRAEWVFREFEDTAPQTMLGRGDVKYHLGHSLDHSTRKGNPIHLSLTFNPSHLEFVNPVVVGRVRGKQDRYGDVERRACLPILIHGDAAFSGQGVVHETNQMMALEGYAVGGTIHVVVNNQIGFTTMPTESRSSPYCTDLARMAQCPILHVNGEDPEAVVHATRVATEFRQTFGRDVVIDMYCFRRFGHNEGDEPRFTQPEMYEEIDRHPALYQVYGSVLTQRGLISKEECDQIFARQQQELEGELAAAREEIKEAMPEKAQRGVWVGYFGGRDPGDADTPRTAVDVGRFEQIVRGLVTVPEGFEVHSKLNRLLKRRAASLTDRTATLDWGMGEMLAYGALVLDGHPVRISGQDCQRGTFSHRHAVFRDHRNGACWTPLSCLSDNQATFEVLNSPLSEAGVLGFEYGYSLDRPEALVVWEAQFGDFANGAQVIIDQFVVASEDKWNRLSGLTLFLPHGYEGQGPEHSSARLERFLQLCADDNMRVANVTTPAQMFHLLRQQTLRKWRKPLVIMTPKSLLRHKLAVSPVDAFTEGHFHRVIPEHRLEDETGVTRAVFCSGKVYYDLLAEREALNDSTVALIRVEQLYPLPIPEMLEAIDQFGDLTEVIWCQEEPRNMGAYAYLHPYFTNMFAEGPAVRWVCRGESASPATGSNRAHKIEQQDLLDRVFQKGES